jgi:hypothetical protein
VRMLFAAAHESGIVMVFIRRKPVRTDLGVGAGRVVELRQRPCEVRLGHVAERTGLIAVHRELIVIEHCFAKQLDLLHLVAAWCGQPLEGLRLDAIDLGLDLCNFLQGSGRKRYARLLRPHCSAATVAAMVTAAEAIQAFMRRDLVSRNIIPKIGPMFSALSLRGAQQPISPGQKHRNNRRWGSCAMPKRAAL